ncbi:hypothetical protein [Sediminivirga luteola]|uniref:Dicarboxylate carrier MatC N-terminal domain-containing protein n=1 Tax=Sediminivirga luteola TaxID=1774748 RepID=A0A8J2TY02_9MICO|nr:hypothetical protein [Sediminivirga luteola]MCI2265780.1 hypothetical protein [Sediminivirga luteola]GGA14667.1 hypothetical protein GCM10011333_17020 [Sediminivirga luteola]
MDPTLAQLCAIAVFIAVFALGAVRGVQLGVLMFAAAAGTALILSDMSLEDVVGGFPLSIMILLVGVTYFFAIAQANGTVDRLIDAALAKVGSNRLFLPVVLPHRAGPGHRGRAGASGQRLHRGRCLRGRG